MAQSSLSKISLCKLLLSAASVQPTQALLTAQNRLTYNAPVVGIFSGWKGALLGLIPSIVLECAKKDFQVREDGMQPSPPLYISRSTASENTSSPFSVGATTRRARLHAALAELGIPPASECCSSDERAKKDATAADADVVAFLESPEYRGCSAARRMYNSFVLPKSEGALAVAEGPKRAAVVAAGIAFQLREYRSHVEGWIRNHDRSVAEADALFQSTQTKAMKTKTITAGGVRYPLTVVLDNIRSAHNVGNILRAAEAARVGKVLLCGVTPAPPDPKVLKTAVGSADYIPYACPGSTLHAVRQLKATGSVVWGVETTSRSKVVWTVEVPQLIDGFRSLSLVFGNELVGIHASVLSECDEIVCLPTHGIKNSLNVATCASAVMWEILRQWDAHTNVTMNTQNYKSG